MKQLLVCWIVGAAAFAPPRRLATRRAEAARLSAKALDETLASMDVDIMDPSMESRSTLDGCFGRLLDFVQGWVVMWEDSKATGLTTPVEIENTANGARVLFRPRESGYASRDEEKRKEKEDEWKEAGASYDDEKEKKPKKTGGLEFCIERNDVLSCKVSRCDYEPGSVVKEMSEKKIVSRFKSDVAIFEKSLRPK